MGNPSPDPAVGEAPGRACAPPSTPPPPPTIHRNSRAGARAAVPAFLALCLAAGLSAQEIEEPAVDPGEPKAAGLSAVVEGRVHVRREGDDPAVDLEGLMAAPGLPAVVEGRVYTWREGDETRRAYLQADLIVAGDGAVAPIGSVVQPAGDGVIARSAEASLGQGLPVFRSPSGALMTLPGGVLVVFDPGWSDREASAFFRDRGVAADRLSPLGEIPNGFVVETEPGFPSLELANDLAGHAGVRLSAPNWWTQREPR